MMRLYLAGPMRGIEKLNFPAFHEAAARLREQGFEVWNPAEKDEADGVDPNIGAPLKQLKEYMKVDLPAVLDSDAIAVLPGWRDSEGAALEVAVASHCEIPVIDAVTLEFVNISEPDATILEEAQHLVYGARNGDYGHPADDFARTAAMWSAILQVEVTAKQAALCMAAVKISREVNAPKRDNLVDLAGYALVAHRIEQRARGLE